MDQSAYRSVQLANGETLGCRFFGHGPRPVVFIHGNLITSRWWLPLITRFDPAQYTCCAPDLRGAGISSYYRSVESMRQFSEDIFYLAQELNLDTFDLVGLSMGGTVSLQLAADHPEMVQTLVLIDSPNAKGYPFPAKDAEGKMVPGVFWTRRSEVMQDPVQLLPTAYALAAGDRTLIRTLFDLTVFNHVKPDPAVYDPLIEETFSVRNYPDCAWAAQVFNISHIHNGVRSGTGAIDRITMPVLVIQGEHDIIIRPDASRDLVSDIGENAELLLIPAAAHCPHIDQEAAVLNGMLSFYARCPASSPFSAERSE